MLNTRSAETLKTNKSGAGYASNWLFLYMNIHCNYEDKGEYSMVCSNCGTCIQDGDYFCKNCGASLQAPGGVTQRAPMPFNTRLPGTAKAGRRPGGGWQKNPYRDKIAQLRLQLKELRMQPRELNNQIVGTRSNYFEFDSFMQRGPVHNIGRMIEGAQLLGPYQQRKQLQDQIMQIERALLPLEQAQEQWRLQQQQQNEQ